LSGTNPFCTFNGNWYKVDKGGFYASLPAYLVIHNYGTGYSGIRPTIKTPIPSAPAVSIQNNLTENEDIICTLDIPSTDDFNSTIQYSVQWYLNGQQFNGTINSTTLPNDTIPYSETISGQQWYCEITLKMHI